MIRCKRPVKRDRLFGAGQYQPYVSCYSSAIVLNQLLAPVLGASAPEISAAVYTVIGIVILAVVFIFHYCQYTATYLERMMKAQGGVSGLRKNCVPFR